MDIVLEVWDTFIGDRLYSALLPLSISSSVSVPSFVANSPNNSLSLFGAPTPYVYEPATGLLYLEPSKYAYLSAWPRNNIWRQATSFFLITWYVSLLFTCLISLLFANPNISNQDLWYARLLFVRDTFVHFHLGQDIGQSPQVPEETDPSRDCPSFTRIAPNGSSYRSILRC